MAHPNRLVDRTRPLMRGGNFTAQIPEAGMIEWGNEESFRYIIEIDDEDRWHEIGERTAAKRGSSSLKWP